VVELTDDNFNAEVTNSPIPVLVDFWAEWCGPCRMQAPTIEEIAQDNDGKIKVGKLDTDANRDTALKFGISAIPTVILFQNGQPVRKFVGLTSKKDLQAAIEEVL